MLGGACISIALFDVVVFTSEVFHAVVVDVVDYGGACGRNFIPAQVAYVIDERGCLGGRFDVLALRRPVIIEDDRVLILARRTKLAVGVALSVHVRVGCHLSKDN